VEENPGALDWLSSQTHSPTYEHHTQTALLQVEGHVSSGVYYRLINKVLLDMYTKTHKAAHGMMYVYMHVHTCRIEAILT